MCRLRLKSALWKPRYEDNERRHEIRHCYALIRELWVKVFENISDFGLLVGKKLINGYLCIPKTKLMKIYDNFNPTIPETEEQIGVDTLPPVAEELKATVTKRTEKKKKSRNLNGR